MEGQFNSAHYGLYGLSSCTEGSCASQIVEIVLSGLMLLWLLYQFVMQIRLHMRLSFSWQQVMLIQIFLCLSFNICFMATSNIILWYLIQSLMYQFYFTTLVYYFAKKYIEKTLPEEQRGPYVVFFLVLYALFCLAELGIFIYMVNAGLGHCKEIAELIVNGVMIALGVAFFVLAYRNQREEMQKFQEFKVDERAVSPLRTIWLWVLANILGQVVSEIESGLIYGYYGGQECYPIESSLETQVLGPVFMAMTYVLPFCSTLWFYSQRRKQSEESMSLLTQLELSGAQVDVQNHVELICDSTQRAATGSLNEVLL